MKNLTVVDLRTSLEELYLLYPRIDRNHLKDIVICVILSKVEELIELIQYWTYDVSYESAYDIIELIERYTKVYPEERISKVIELAYVLTPSVDDLEIPHPASTAKYKVIRNSLRIIIT